MKHTTAAIRELLSKISHWPVMQVGAGGTIVDTYEIISQQLEENAILKKALEYYADEDGGPYAAGDWHTADGGGRAIEALDRVKKLEGEG